MRIDARRGKSSHFSEGVAFTTGNGMQGKPCVPIEKARSTRKVSSAHKIDS